MEDISAWHFFKYKGPWQTKCTHSHKVWSPGTRFTEFLPLISTKYPHSKTTSLRYTSTWSSRVMKKQSRQTHDHFVPCLISWVCHPVLLASALLAASGRQESRPVRWAAIHRFSPLMSMFCPLLSWHRWTTGSSSCLWKNKTRDKYNWYFYRQLNLNSAHRPDTCSNLTPFW